MNYLLKLLFFIIKHLGIPMLIRETLLRNKVTIVMLHDIDKVKAKFFFKFLKEKYNIISLDLFIEAIYTKNNKILPKKAIIVTLDDGHINNYELLPIIKNLKIPISIFLCAGIVNTNRSYWFKFSHPLCVTKTLDLVSNNERLKYLNKFGFSQVKEFSSPQSLNKLQISEMKPYVNFHSHSVFHPCLPKCTDEVSRSEIFNSKKILEEQFDLNIKYFAFPNGDYSIRDIEYLKESLYLCSLTVDFGYNSIETNPYLLRRISINDKCNINEFEIKLSGIVNFINLYILRRKTKWTHEKQNRRLNAILKKN